MCKHDDADRGPQPASILGRLTGRRPRIASGIGLGSWIAAITVLILYGSGIGPRSITAFVFEDSWLVGLGSIGVPVLAFGLLGRRLSIRALELIGVGSFVGAAVITALAVTHHMIMETWTSVFVLILLLAMGIDAANGAYGLDRRAILEQRVRAEERAAAALALEQARRERDAAVEDAFLAGIAKSFEAQHARAGELQNVLASNTEDLSAACAVLHEELANRHTRRATNAHSGHGAAVLRLVTGNQSPLKQTGTDHD